MTKKLGTTIAGIVVIVAGAGGGWFWWHSRDSTSDSTNHTSSASSTIPLDAGTGSGSNVSSAGQIDVQSNNLSNSDKPAAGSGNSNSLPDFKQFDQYKTAQNALFGDTTKGNGAEAVAGKQVSIKYTVWLTTNQLVDQSDPTKPYTFTIGQHTVLLGMEEGVVGMKVGGKRLVIVPPAVGYGNQVKGPVPANSVLVFQVELTGVQ